MKWTNIVSEVVEDLLLQISSPPSSTNSTTDSDGDLSSVSGCGGDVNYDGDDECGGHDSIHRLRNSVSSRGSSRLPSEESMTRRTRRRRARRRERDIKVR